ncbi:MAG: nitroreductase, partial [Clostridia bacterium]|nr:nitroreductase [Clostridia bacterium]
MDILIAMQQRHSVRSYLDKQIENFKISQLNALAKECNEQSGLDIQVVANHPDAFDNFLARYGKIKGAQNYIAMVGNKGKD